MIKQEMIEKMAQEIEESIRFIKENDGFEEFLDFREELKPHIQVAFDIVILLEDMDLSPDDRILIASELAKRRGCSAELCEALYH